MKGKQFALLLFFIITALCLTLPAFGADKYVRKGASGSGTSWSDAYNDLNNVSWSGIGSGDTLWIAAGTYTGGLPTVTTSGITIKRATVADHGTSTGWSDAYDNQVTVDTQGVFLTVNASNFTFDGKSNNPWKFRVVGVRNLGGMFKVGTSGSPNTVMIRNLEMDGNREWAPSGGNEDGFRVGGATNLTIEHCYIHDYIYVQGGSHSDGLQMPSGTNFTYRYNISVNNGMHVFLGDVAWLGSNGWVNNIRIYGNLFYNTNSSDSYDTIDCKNCNSSSAYYMYVENNTFDTPNAYSNRVFVYKNGSDPTQLYFRNNVLYNSTPSAGTSGTHSYNNYYGITAPSETGSYVGDPKFVDRTNRVYSLQSTSPVKDIGTNVVGYTQDLLGTTLPTGSGSGYPMGAYAYATGTTGSLAKPNPPTNLRTQ